MSTLTKEHTSAFHASVDLLVQLHREMLDGDPDGSAADAIRDQMDQPWYSMTSDEQKLVGGLSGDLYSIGEERGTIASLPDRAKLQQFDEAISKNRWEEVLDITRALAPHWSRLQVARIRGIAWLKLKCPSAAIEFFQEAKKLGATDDPNTIELLTESLVRAGRTSEAEQLRSEVIHNSTDPFLRLSVNQGFWQGMSGQPYESTN